MSNLDDYKQQQRVTKMTEQQEFNQAIIKYADALIEVGMYDSFSSAYQHATKVQALQHYDVELMAINEYLILN